MGRKYCGGVVESLHGQYVLLSGKTYVDGKDLTKAQLRPIISQNGGRNAPDRSQAVTLVVWGEFQGSVVDPVHSQSKKVVYAAQQRSWGNHICVVDSGGISQLLRGTSAPCLETHAVNPRKVEVRRSPVELTVADVFGGPVEPHEVSVHDPAELNLDLSALDRGTAAHEALIVALRAHLASKGIGVRGPSPTAPRFDAGWETTGENPALFIAELKSLTDATESQQIRLGIGQVLDYTHAVGAMPERRERNVQPVLVLEHAPTSERWRDLSHSIGITLSWAPDFPGL